MKKYRVHYPHASVEIGTTERGGSRRGIVDISFYIISKYVHSVNGKGKVHPIAGHEGPEGE
jgi:hypothetical protein